ncbi:hypothetical protein AAFC00_001715 [Neodothiora populina]|uniref:Spindle pole body component n=1 Tax=Neodothiora populina TaxID=2781224 RepID=A0ABR3PQA6_9PEZI
MAAREQRVDDALQQLICRLIPFDEEVEDEAAEEQRLEEGLLFARDTIGRDVVPGTAEDVNHAADLIKKKLIRENDRPDKAAKFSNLYSRLLSQPVLTQKWAILYFLYRMVDAPDSIGPSAEPSPSPAEAQDSDVARAGAEAQRARSRVDETRERDRHERGYSADSPAFNAAFSRNGLPNISRTGEEKEPQRKQHNPLHQHQQQHQQQHQRQTSLTGARIPANSPLRPRSVQQQQLEQRASVSSELDSTILSGPSEPQLLRDLPFTLQGLSSNNLLFAGPASLKLPPALPVPILSLLHTLAEPSLLYKSLSSFVESSDGGLVAQSLRSAIAAELRAYLGLVATLEGQIRRALTQLAGSPGSRGLGKAGVTLKRCVVWTREATMGLRLMSMLVEESKGKKGGELISLIHTYSSSHGDPFVYTFAERLLLHVTKPFYAMLQHWIYDGELEDPFLEFFVEENHDLDELSLDPRRGGGATSVWEDKYRLNESMIPSILTPDFAKKIFLIGKSLNFISYGCGDSVWVENHSKDSSQELKYGDTTTLESSIDSAYKRTMARLIHLMDTRFKLFEHLTALKKYLLLGQGDFIALLMESLASNLDRPANSQYRHTLTAQLEHAIRNSNAQYDSPDVLRRLDARMLELSHGEIGWDVFTLEYRVDSPLDVIVTPWASKQYLKVFNFLWRIKRVEFALGSTWRRCMTGARGVLGAVGDKVDADWKNARGGIAEMIHFVSQLQHYILFEVIEAGWEGLQRAMRNPDATLDTLISAHTSYLRSITRKGLLASSSSQHQSGSSTTGAAATPAAAATASSPDFTIQLHELLKLMLAYKDVVDNLYSYSVAEFTRRQDLAAKIETRTAAGGWGISEKDNNNNDTSAASSPGLDNSRTNNRQRNSRKRDREPSDPDSPIPPLVPPLFPPSASSSSTIRNQVDETSMLLQLRERLKSLADEFRVRVNVLLGDLAYQPDVDMRFLGVVMNFNDVYSPVRRGRRRTNAAGAANANANVGGGGAGAGGDGKEKDKEKDRSRQQQQQQGR